jgi:hypothetical protein
MNLWSLRDQESGEKTFNSFQDAGAVDMACAIIEQAVIDWKDLEYGKLKRVLGRPDYTFVYSEEVKVFFQSAWFEHLLSFALPHHTPQQVRKALRIPEPRRRRRCVRT